MVQFSITANGTVSRSILPPALPHGTPAEGSDPTDARSWVDNDTQD